MLCSTIRDILVRTERKYGREDAVRYKVKKDTIESKAYTCLKNDSESFSRVLDDLGERGEHVAVIGATSYPWLVTFFGIVDSGSVAVPLDAGLPKEELCGLMDRAACMQAIENAGLPQPGKSSCFFCPSMRAEEIIHLRDHHPDLFRRAIALEDNARPNLKTVQGLGRNYSWKERYGKEFCTHGNC